MWLDQPEDEEKKAQVDGQNQPSIGAGAGSAPTQPTGTTGNPSTISPTSPTAPRQDFATVQDYLGANKQQGEQLGQKLTSSLGESLGKQKDTIAGAANQAKSDVTGGTTGFDSSLVSSALEDPTRVAGDTNQLESFLGQWNAQYKGPESFETSTAYDPAAAAANEAKTKQAQIESAGGQQQLIQDQFGVYGQGNKGLDQALFQNASGFSTAQDQAKQFGGIGDYLSQQAKDVNTAAKTAKDVTGQTQANTRGAFEGNLTNFQAGLNAKTAASRKTADDVIAKYQKNLASADPDKIKANLAEANVDPAVASNIVEYLTALNTNYGIKPEISSAYIGNPAVDITNATVASPEDYAKAAAYEKLTGVNYGGVLNPADAAKAKTGLGQTGTLKGNDLKRYLSDKLGIQDKSLLGTKPVLDWTAVNDGKVNSVQAKKQVSDILAAGKRQGIDPTKNPALDSIDSNAHEGVQAIIKGGENINTRPALKVYADTAVAAQIAKGKTEKEAQQEINKWINQLAYQIGNKTGVPPIYPYANDVKTPGKPDVQIPENVFKQPQVNPGLPTPPLAVVPTNPIVEPGQKPQTGPGNAPNAPAKTGTDLSNQLLAQYTKNNPGAKVDFVNNAKAELKNIAGMYDTYLNGTITPKNKTLLQTMLKKYGASL